MDQGEGLIAYQLYDDNGLQQLTRGN
jgi:hypothetical protein